MSLAVAPVEDRFVTGRAYERSMQAEHSFDAGGLGEGSQTQEPPDGDHEGPSFTEMDPTGRYGRVRFR